VRQRRPVFERDRGHRLLRGNKIRSVIGSLPMTKTGRARFPLSVASATKDQSFASPSLVEHPSVSRRIARPPTYGAAWGRARSRTSGNSPHRSASCNARSRTIRGGLSGTAELSNGLEDALQGVAGAQLAAEGFGALVILTAHHHTSPSHTARTSLPNPASTAGEAP
jgi:hypothetical protein